MTNIERHEATLEIEIDEVKEVRKIHREICRDCNIVQIKSMRNHINKKLLENVIEISHMPLSEIAINTMKINGVRPIIQPTKGSISSYSTVNIPLNKVQIVEKSTKAVMNNTRRSRCIKCTNDRCFIRRHVLDNGKLGFKGDTMGGVCRAPITLEEAISAPAYWDNSNLPMFNHKITMLTIEMVDGVWTTPTVYRQPNHTGLFQYSGMKGVSAVGNEKLIAPMYRRNLSITTTNYDGKNVTKQMQTYHKMAVAHFNGIFALVMIAKNSEIEASTLYDYPPVGIINNIGVRGVKK